MNRKKIHTTLYGTGSQLAIDAAEAERRGISYGRYMLLLQGKRRRPTAQKTDE